MAFSKGDIAAPFIQVKEDENGVLQDIKFVNDDNFNFAYDVVDKMAKKDPDKVGYRAYWYISYIRHNRYSQF